MDDAVAKALHAIRHHLAGGGFLSDLFSGPDYLSTGEAASPTNWGDSELASDFFKADKAMRLAREAQAKEPDRDVPLPLRRPVAEAAPRSTVAAPPPAPAPAPMAAPVNIPYVAPTQLMRMTGENTSPLHLTERPGFGQSLTDSDPLRINPSLMRADTTPEIGGRELQTYTLPEAALARPGQRAEINRAVSLAQNLAPAQPEVLPTAAEALAAVEKLHNAGVYSGAELDKAGEILAAHNRAKMDNIPVEEALRLIRAEGPPMVNQGMPREERPAVRPMAYTATPAAAPAVSAIDQATGKLTARAGEEPNAVPLTAKQGDLIARTIAAETSGKSPEEAQAIASVILNRIRSGEYGSSPEAVLFAKRQFEPWMNPAGNNYPLKISPTGQRYLDAQAALEAALSGEDITGGATHFWGPKAQEALGRNPPSWSYKAPGVDIGETRFHKLERAEGGEIHGDSSMRHDDIVSRALHMARRHFDGSDGSYVDPMGSVAYGDNNFTPVKEIVPVRERERQTLTPSSMARAWTPPEKQDAIDGRRASSPSPEGFTRGLQTVGEGIVPAGEMVGDYLKSRFYDPGQQFAPNADTSPRTFRSAVADLKGPEETTKDMMPNQFLRDVGSAGSSIAHGFYEDPAGFIGGMFPPIAVAQSGAGISDLSEAVAKAKASGDMEAAKKLSAAASFLAAAPLIPGAKMAADEAIAAAKATARKVISPTAEVAGSAFPQLPASVRALDIARGEAAPNDIVSGMTGAFAPKEAPIRGQTGLEIKAMQERALNPEEMDKLTALRAQSPEFAQASKFLLPEELKGVIANPRQIEPMVRLLEVIPQAEQMSSLAKAGAPKQGWYRGSTQALMDVFGPQDAPRFSALLAATSPQTSVESNLLNTLNIWKNWEAAGRPTDPAAIKRVMGASVQGAKGEDSILDAWVNNSIRALATPDPRAITLSGPKVNSFFRNLADDVYRVTNDAWISNATNIDQGLLRVSPTAQQLAAGNPGYSPGYLALSARQREGGQMARMLPSEAQETIWSVAMPLMEGATKAGMHPREFLQRGLLTPDLIRGTPDFSTLLRSDPKYASVIQQMGRGEQLEKMQPFNFPRQLPEMTASDVANLEKTADTLGNLRERRLRESRSLFPGYTPEQEKTFAHVTTSGIPGRNTGVAEDLIDAPAGSRANFSSRVSNVFQDPTGMDILHKNLGLNPVSTVPSTEVWRPSMQGPVGGMGTSLAHATEYRPPLEVGRGYTASVEAPVTLNKKGQKIVDPEVERALEVASTLRGAMTAQHGTPHHALIGDPTGAGTAFTFPKKVDAGDQQARFGMLGALNTEPLAIADTGRTLSAFPWGQTAPFTDADRTWMKNLAGATEAIPVTNIAGKKSYVDLSSEFAQPEGSRAVTQRVTSALNKLSPEELGRLDNVELRRAAGDLHDMYASQNAKGNRVRPDFLNMLSIMRDKGLKGLQAAYRKKEFLPVLAALGLGDQMVNGTSASGEQ